MKNFFFLYFICYLLFVSCSNFSNEINLNTDSFQISFDKKGVIQKLVDKNSGHNYLAKDTPAPRSCR